MSDTDNRFTSFMTSFLNSLEIDMSQEILDMDEDWFAVANSRVFHSTMDKADNALIEAMNDGRIKSNDYKGMCDKMEKDVIVFLINLGFEQKAAQAEYEDFLRQHRPGRT